MKTITGTRVSPFEDSLGTEIFRFKQLNSSVEGLSSHGRSAFGIR